MIERKIYMATDLGKVINFGPKPEARQKEFYFIRKQVGTQTRVTGAKTYPANPVNLRPMAFQ